MTIVAMLKQQHRNVLDYLTEAYDAANWGRQPPSLAMLWSLGRVPEPLYPERLPLIFEDGLQSRDFVHVSDIVQANLLVMKNGHANYEVFNIGTGRSLTVSDVARALSKALGVEIEHKIVGQFREGDIRHCYADISKGQRVLGYTPKVAFEDGISDLVEWVSEQESLDLVDNAARELEMRGLTK